jgi:hypothetical protein
MQFRLQSVGLGFEVKQNPQAEACAAEISAHHTSILRFAVYPNLAGLRAERI